MATLSQLVLIRKINKMHDKRERYAIWYGRESAEVAAVDLQIESARDGLRLANEDAANDKVAPAIVGACLTVAAVAIL